MALFVTPTHAEQQLFNFFVTGAASNDVTNPAFGGPQTSFQSGCCRTYHGPGQGPHDAPVIPGGFTTTNNGPGSISEASAQFVGTKGSAVTGTRATDAYDGYGVIGFRQGGSIVVNYGGLTVTRAVDTTHGRFDGGATPITVNFANGGVANAARWVDTFTNNTASPISGSGSYFGNLGSDHNTTWVASSSGNALAPTGNRWLTSIQAGPPSDPVITHVLGNNAYTTTTAQMVHSDTGELPEWQYPITVNPGQTKTIILIDVLTADLNYGFSTVAADIALGGQLANLITNNGAPIAADSLAFNSFFADLGRDALMTVVNYDFVGLTIDQSRPFFIQTDFAVTQPTAIFDGGVLKPTTAVNFNQNFQLNALGGTIDSSNGIQTFNGTFSGTGALTLTGTNAAILNNTNSYTGATNVNGGRLVVNGSIATSSMTTVNAGGTLAGTGTVGNTTVAGGTFAPGNGSAGSSMTVNGNLAFQSAATYMVQINPATSSFATVSGTATLNGATVNAVFAPGSYVAKQYTILNASGGVGGTFGAVTNTNLPSGFTTSASYDANHAYLNLALFSFPTGLNQNQQSVADALTNSFNTAGGIPMVYGALTARGLTIASGELGTGSQQTTYQAMNIFMGLLGDPTITNRGDAIVPQSSPAPQWAEEDERAVAYASDGTRRSKSERDAYAAMYRKAMVKPVDTAQQRWSVWAAGFGGSLTTDGNAATGSNTITSRVYGTAVGADYRLGPNTIAGVAAAGGGTNFGLVNGLGSGRSDLFQAGAFVRHTVGPAYFSAALAYGWQDITTDRTVTLAGVDHLHAQFRSDAFSGRFEAGYRFLTPWTAITPYAAGQFTTFSLPGYAEQVLVGTPAFALSYVSKDVTFPRSELGLRADKSFAMQDAILTLRGRAAWAHDFNVDRNIAATFQALPVSTFTVNGAAQARDSALISASAELKWVSGWSVAATFDGEFSNVTRSYAGKGIVRYAW